MNKYLTTLFVFIAYCYIVTPLIHAQDKLQEQLPNNLGVTKTFEDGFLNVRIESNKLKVTFLDKDKNIITPPYPEAFVRYEYRLDPRGSASSKPQYTTLLRKTDKHLLSERIIRPPHYLIVFITLREAKQPENQPSRYSSPYSATKKAKARKVKALPRIILNQLPPAKETQKNLKTSAAPSRKKYGLSGA